MSKFNDLEQFICNSANLLSHKKASSDINQEIVYIKKFATFQKYAILIEFEWHAIR